MIDRGRVVRRYVLTFASALIGTATPLMAQETDSTRVDRRTVIGVGLGMGSVPSAFRPACGVGAEGKVPAVSADVRLGRRFGAIRVESSTTTRGAYILEACQPIPPTGTDGVQTIRATDMHRGEGLKMTDVRIGHTSGAGNSWFLIVAGAGWAWSHGTPVLLAGAGLRLGGQLRFSLDAELHHYRIRWKTTTAEWRDREMIREISRRYDYGWKSGLNVRFGVELQK